MTGKTRADAAKAQNQVRGLRSPQQKPISQGLERVRHVAPQAAYRRVQGSPNTPAPADLLALQRAAGNRGVQRVLAQRAGGRNGQQPAPGGLAPRIQRNNPPVVAEPPVRANAQACLVHLHGNEPNALAVAKDLHNRFCVNLTYIDHPGHRNITIDVPGVRGLACQADPNRIFQDVGIDAKWADWNAKTPACLRDPNMTAAKQAVKDFRDQELNPKIRQCRTQAVDASGAVSGTGVSGSAPVVAFHNNTNNGNLTINSYLPGGSEARATETDQARLAAPFAAIQQNPGAGNPAAPSNPHVQRRQDVDDFILVTDPQDFVNTFRAGRNVVLQSPSPPQDGSLSVVLSSGRYVNVEAQQGRRSNAIQQSMGEQALAGLGVSTACPQTTTPGGAAPSTPSPAQPVQRRPALRGTGAPAMQLQPGENRPVQTPGPGQGPAVGGTSASTGSILHDPTGLADALEPLMAELNRVLGQVATMPVPLPREAPPPNLPKDCRTFADQAALDARKAHWVSVIGGMPLTQVVNWLIGLPPGPPAAVTAEVAMQRDCMFRGLAASPRVTLPSTPRSKWAFSKRRDFAEQKAIWTQKFNFTRETPFDRISDRARSACGSLLDPSETRWDTAEPRHRACWGVRARGGKSLPPMPAGARSLTVDERQQEILEASSAPGTSRHHWGTDMDIFSENPADFMRGKPFADEYAWMLSNAAIYGFSQAYTAASAFMRLGYMEERWHWSYWPISQALLEFARAHQADIQTALAAQWGTGPQFSFISQNWRSYMFNVNETPGI